MPRTKLSPALSAASAPPPRPRPRTVKGPKLNELLGKRSPRQWICYHNAAEWGFDIDTPNPVYTGKRLKVASLMGDKVWTVARASDDGKYYLTGYFIISTITVRPKTKTNRAGLSLDGNWARAFRPLIPLARQPWFQAYVHEQQGLSHGFQRIKDRAILAGLEKIATNRPTVQVVP